MDYQHKERMMTRREKKSQLVRHGRPWSCKKSGKDTPSNRPTKKEKETKKVAMSYQKRFSPEMKTEIEGIK